MDSGYQIALHVRTPDGFETYAEFFLGNKRLEATNPFKTLHGSYNITYDSILLMELRVMSRGLPIDIRMRHCTLDEIAESCRTSTKYLFGVTQDISG